MSRAITIFGYGSQGRAHAQNFRDAGWEVCVVVRAAGESAQRATADGFQVEHNFSAATQRTTIGYLLCADDAQPELWQKYLDPHLPQGASICFAHGYNLHYQHIAPRSDLDILLAAPMCPGAALREHYLQKTRAPIITAVHQDASGNAASTLNTLTAAVSNNCGDIIPSAIAEETETNLFAEQALLIGGLSHLIIATFDTMVEAGYNPKLAYYWCLHDMRDCAKLFADQGPAGALQGISRTARHGGLTRGPRIINDRTQGTLKQIVQEIQSGKYADELHDTMSASPDVKWRDHLLQKLHDDYSAI